MKRVCFYILPLLLLHASLCVANPVVHLWEGTDIKAKSVTLTSYLPQVATTTMAVIVCPGGSYCWHDTENEGTLVARWLNENGIAAFVLNYRVQGKFQYITHSRLLFGGRQYPDMLQDLQKAILFVRTNADKYHINEKKVGVMGFSAGGHLAMSSAAFFKTDHLTPLGIKVNKSLRPDFVATIYPVVTMKKPFVHKRSRRALLGELHKSSHVLQDSLSLEKHIPTDCPPVFLVNCKDDNVVKYENSILLDSALTRAKVPHRYIQYATGRHGFGASERKGTSESRMWKKEFLNWINNFQF